MCDWAARKARFKSNTTGTAFLWHRIPLQHRWRSEWFHGHWSGCERGTMHTMWNNQAGQSTCNKTHSKSLMSYGMVQTKMQDITDTIIENISTVYAEHTQNDLFHDALPCVQQAFIWYPRTSCRMRRRDSKQSKFEHAYDFQRDACSRSSINLRSTTAVPRTKCRSWQDISPRLVS